MAQLPEAVTEAAQAVHRFVSSVNVDDSAVPYFELVLGFIVVEYVFNTVLDLRQRQVRSSPEQAW